MGESAGTSSPPATPRKRIVEEKAAMKLNNRLSAGVLAAFLGIAAAGCAHDRSLGEVGSDAAISTKVKAALLGDPDVAGTSITVETLRGTVQLSGFAKSAQAAQRS